LQAWFAGQSLALMHPQVPPARHRRPDVTVTEVQSAHEPPAGPQAVLPLPGWHVAPLQHWPLHGWSLSQLVEHTPAMQARPTRQSACDAQPQLPLTHLRPPTSFVQSLQLLPQAVSSVPG
jgi:hypothetical protein